MMATNQSVLRQHAEALAILDANIMAEDNPRLRDVAKRIKDCIISSRPIPKDLQEQYVKYASTQKQDRFGR